VSDPIELLRALIRCPSVTPTTAGVLDVVEAALAPLGFTVTRPSFSGGGSYPVDNLFATRGAGGPHLLFCGHTDVVPPGDEALWTHPPFAAEEADGRIYGRGAADMKSGIAAFIAAIATLGPVEGRISLAITNDEEADAINGTARLTEWALEQGHNFDFAIVGEPSSTAAVGDSVKIGRRGSFNGRISVTGTQGHVAYPDRALNPMPVVGAVAVALSSAPLDRGTAHFPPTNLEITSIDTGNGASNVIPAAGTIRFNIRYNDLWTPETLTEWVEARIASVVAGGTSIRFEMLGRPARAFLSPPDGPVALVQRVIAEVTGRSPELSTGGGTSDARFIAPHCRVVELGLAGPSMHKADESVAIADVVALADLYSAVLKAYFAGPTG
jgi:succinyl-diaminopimelate desuccinylase